MPLYLEMISHKVRWAFHQETMGLSCFWASVGPNWSLARKAESLKAWNILQAPVTVSGRQRDLLPRYSSYPTSRSSDQKRKKKTSRSRQGGLSTDSRRTGDNAASPSSRRNGVRRRRGGVVLAFLPHAHHGSKP